jgi:sugar/nucleoside kinase (ribokinase family)
MLKSSTVTAQISDLDILLIGHITRDLLTSDPRGPYRVGGTVSFAAVTALRLGRRPTIITRAGPELDLSELPPQIDLHILPSSVTTTFANIYTANGRIQFCFTPAPPITVDDIPVAYHRPRAVLLGPLVNEIGPDIAALFRSPTQVVAGPQGWMRRWDETGRVFSKPWDTANEILPYLNVLVLSQEDIDFDLARLDPFFDYIAMIVLTEYRDGSTLYLRNTEHNISKIKIPPRPAKEVDPTGAGDIFATAFMIRLQETNDPIQAARFANVTASYGVEAEGVAGIPTRAQVMTYMDQHPFEVE